VARVCARSDTASSGARQQRSGPGEPVHLRQDVVNGPVGTVLFFSGLRIDTVCTDHLPRLAQVLSRSQTSLC